MDEPVNKPEKKRNTNHSLETFQESVPRKATRKMEAQQRKGSPLWFGLGMFGMVGWAVTIPTLIGIAVGVWIDTHWPSKYSWTLMMLFIGLILGCLNAWYWVHKESSTNK